jgi:DNA (cytosine-5)-methyltransferase 1
MTLTVTDLFCGAGGSSLGAEAVPGVRLVMAANHWETAIDVHQANFPDAGHDCADISQADPRRYPVTDVLLASPECTNHSQARGVSRQRQDPTLWDAPDPSAERSRATMWDVVRFAEQNRYAAVVVENVVEATKWVGWRGWHVAMEDLGYEHVVLSHNSMHHGVPQSRDRIYVVFWRGRRPNLDLEMFAHCDRCAAGRMVRQAWKNGRMVGRYRQQWVWICTVCGSTCEPAARPAADVIDWALPCPRIGDRARPLAAATRARILAGLQRYGWAPVVTAGAGNVYETTPGNRARPLSEPLPVQQTTATQALATPPAAFALNTAHGGRLHDLADPHPTVCASDDRLSLVIAMRNNGRPWPTTGPVPTVTAGGTHHALVMRNNTARGDQGQMVTPTSEPVRTVTTKGHQSLLMPYYGSGQVQAVDRPVPTVTTRDRCALIDAEDVVDDCGFRMLEPHEIAAAMAFPDGYIPTTYSKKDRVKLAGNAVTPPVMTWIVGRVAEALGGAA